MTASPQTGMQRKADGAPAKSREKLLLVDDDPGILRQLAWSFPDHEVLTAIRSGRGARHGARARTESRVPRSRPAARSRRPPSA